MGRWLALLVLGAAAVVGCGGSTSDGTAPAGTPGGPCLPGGECNIDLVCRGDRCVSPDALPQGARARGAVSIIVEPLLAACPPDVPRNVPSDAEPTLKCDPNFGSCDPGSRAVEDGQAARVSCRVAQAGGTYTLSVELRAESTTFNASGRIVDGGGGSLIVSEWDDMTNKNLTDFACSVGVKSIEPGAIWASFDCPAFGEPNSASPPICMASGAFAFQNCDG